jgi:cobalt-zinc-cadmium efflux system membrane fusion protein
MSTRPAQQFVAILLYAAFCPVLSLSCSAAKSEDLSFRPAPAKPTAEGVVKVRPESAQFVEVAVVGGDSTPALVRSPGRVAFRDAAVARVGAPVHGRVATIAVHVGDHVRKGQHLLTLSSPESATMHADLERAAVAERTAAAEVERQRTMSARGVGIQSELVAADARWQEARADLERARTSAAFLGRGQGGSVDMRAPIDGDVLTLRATLGSTVQPDGEPVVELGDPNDLWLVTEVFERELPLIRVGGLATAEVASLPAPAKLHVLNVGAQVDPSTRRAPVYLTFDHRDPSLRAGMFARVSVEASSESSVGVPASAVLVKEGGRTIVYVAVDRDSFVVRDVTVGHPVDGKVPVFNGLQPGERVAVRGALLLDSAAEQLL